MSDKFTLRKTLLAERQAFLTEVRSNWDFAINSRVLDWWQSQPVKTLGVYWPIRGEPDLTQSYVELASRGVQLALPVVVARDAPLQFAAWSPGDPMVKDSFGVAVPAQVKLVENLNALLIPCVAFNPNNVRLGYGGGFYDRTLATMPDTFTVGIAYASACASFEAEEHDVPLKLIITDSRLSQPCPEG